MFILVALLCYVPGFEFFVAPVFFRETGRAVQFQSDSAVTNMMSDLNKDVRYQKTLVFG